MPTEDELRDALASAPVPRAGSGLDARDIVRRSRRRRLPGQIGAGVVSAAAVLTLVVGGVNGFWLSSTAGGGGTASDQSMQEDAPATEPAPESGTTLGPAPADRVNLCSGSLADVGDAPSGLELTTEFPDAPAGEGWVEGTVTMTNTGDERVVGTTAATPVITLSQDGMVLWHSNGPTILSLVEVDLEPGESLEYATSFQPVRCDVEDDETGAFREGLPALPPGVYDVSALIDLTRTDIPGAPPELVGGPIGQVTLE